MAIDKQYDGEIVNRATNFQNREIAVSDQSSPTDKSKPTWRQSPETEKSTKKSTEKSTEKSAEKSTKIQLKSPIESVPMKSTRWSPKRTSKDDYRIKINLRVNAEY
jgi:hypothetical protein